MVIEIKGSGFEKVLALKKDRRSEGEENASGVKKATRPGDWGGEGRGCWPKEERRGRTRRKQISMLYEKMTAAQKERDEEQKGVKNRAKERTVEKGGRGKEPSASRKEMSTGGGGTPSGGKKKKEKKCPQC